MVYIISSRAVSEIVKYVWDCDFYGNTIVNDNTDSVYNRMNNELEPFLLTHEKDHFEQCLKLFNMMYKDTQLKVYIFKESEFKIIFPKCWHNKLRMFISDKYKKWQDAELT